MGRTAGGLQGCGAVGDEVRAEGVGGEGEPVKVALTRETLPINRDPVLDPSNIVIDVVKTKWPAQ